MTPEKLDAEFGARNLISRYALAMDDRRVEDLLGLFAQDAVLTVMGKTYEGRDGVATWVNAMAANPPGKHMVSNTYIDHDGDALSSASDFVFFVPVDKAWRIAAGGRYLDMFKKVDGTWMFARRDVVLDMRGM